MSTDSLLRELTGSSPPALVRLIAGAAVAEHLRTDFPTTQERRVDALALLDDGRILHLEWQSDYDATMPQRMLGYWLLIQRVYPGRVIEQAVIQTGGSRPIAAGLSTAALEFRYQVIDSRAVDPTPLLDSPALADNILSVLFGPTADLAPRLRRILGRMAALPERAQRDAFVQLLTLARARRITNLVMEEMEAMPLQIDPSADPYSAQLMHEGRMAGLLEGRMAGRMEGLQAGEVFGEAKALIRQVERRFGPLPPGGRERILASDAATIENWLDRVLDATTLEGVFADAPLN